MILCAGLSPAWQHTLLFDTLRMGEVNRAREVHWCASGKVINAARAAHRLAASDGTGLRVRAMTVLGGATGAQMQGALGAEGLDVSVVETRAATRVCTTVIGCAERVVTELVEEAGALDQTELNTFRSRFRAEAQHAEAMVLMGSLPAGAPVDDFRRLVEGLDVPTVLDIRGPELLATLPLKPFLVKPNREELARTVGQPIGDETELVTAMQELVRRGAQWVLVSQGAEAVWVLGEGRLYRIRPPRIEIVNPIGSGDCLAGGIGFGVASGLAPLDAIRLGIAAAADNATSLLPGHIDPASVIRRLGDVRVEAA
jgi:1-phosphofructokinase family hexose kinase